MKPHHMQMVLFDASGAPPFDLNRDSISSKSEDVDFDVAGMRFRFFCETEHKEALEIVLDGLGLAHMHEPNRLDTWLASGRPLVLGTWEMDSFAIVRDCLDNGVIRIYEQHGTLEISLPHPDVWSANGLQWLREFQPCCQRNRKNPTPWLGPSCGCTPCK